jgi:hypothetical protein
MDVGIRLVVVKARSPCNQDCPVRRRLPGVGLV